MGYSPIGSQRVEHTEGPARRGGGPRAPPAEEPAPGPGKGRPSSGPPAAACGAGLRPTLWRSSPQAPPRCPHCPLSPALMGLWEQTNGVPRSPCRALAGEVGCGTQLPPAASSTDAGYSLQPATATTTRTGSCSSSCSRGTSSRRPCGGSIRDGCNCTQSSPSASSWALCRPQCMSPLRPAALARPAATPVRPGGGRSSEQATAF